MSDKTTYGQSLTHMIKGNLGAGILSMPRSFANLGLVGGLLALPLLCIISGYCVHILIKSSRLIGRRLNEEDLNYSILARRSFELGPSWMSNLNHTMSRIVDTALLVTQIGVCCVYIVFIVDNVTTILASYHIHLAPSITFLALFPITLLLSFIRTLSRLAIASLIANLIQALGLILIVEYLLRDMKHDTLRHDNFRPMNEMALGFGSVMFAFEGISVVLPIYNRISKRKQMGSMCGVINVSFFVILMLYMVVGLLGYLRYGPHVKDSITLNLPAEPLYDAVRALFTTSILLSYPLQFYVPNEIIWEWAKRNILSPPRLEVELDAGEKRSKDLSIIQKIEIVVPSPAPMKALEGKQQAEKLAAVTNNMNIKPGEDITFKGLMNVSEKYTPKPDQGPEHFSSVPLGGTAAGKTGIGHHPYQGHQSVDGESPSRFGSRVDLITDNSSGGTNSSSCLDCKSLSGPGESIPVRYEYFCRILVVVLTFTLAFSVPKLNLLMDLIGSFSGVLLCLVIPSLIHMASYWEKLRGFKKYLMIVVDLSIVILGLAAGLGGSFSSLNQIIKGDH